MSARREAWGWMIDFTFRHLDGRRERIRRKSPVQTRTGAESFERQLRQAMLAEPREQPGPTLSAFCGTYLQHAAVNNRPSSAASKAYALRNHLLPFFGSMPLASIGLPDLEAFKVQQLSLGLRPKTINNQLVMLHRALTLAEGWHLLKRPPRSALLRVAPPVTSALTDEECSALVGASSEPWRTMILCALHTGMRLGELRGLRWDDIDLVERLITVRRSAGRTAAEPDQAPKSNERRDIPINATLAAALRAHRHMRGPHVFCRDDGHGWGQTRCAEAMAQCCERAGIRAVGWHALRHTFATRLAAAGVPLHEIQRLLGHATLTMTLRYAHVVPSSLREAVARLDPPGSLEAGPSAVRGGSR